MLTLKRFWYENKYEIIITILGVLAGVFATLGRDAAFCMWAPDGILVFCSETSRIIVGSLLFPLVMVVCGLTFKDVRQKVIAIIYSKFIVELTLISIGVNINCFSPVFWGDFSALFFISADVILLLSLLSEKVEKNVSGGVLIAVIAVSLFTVAINGENAGTSSYIYRSLYAFFIYLSVTVVLNDLPERKSCSNKRAEFKREREHEKAVVKLVSVMFMVALSAATTLCFVMVSRHSNIIPINEKYTEVVCYISWCALYLLVAVFIFSSNFKISMLKNLVFAFCVAAISTISIMILNSYGHLLEYNFFFGDEVNFRYYKFFVSDLTFTYGFGWLRYPAVFISGFFISFIVFMIASKKQLNDINKIIDKLKASVLNDDEEFEFCEDEDYNFDGKRTKTTGTEWSSLSEGDTFTLGGKLFDTLLIFKGDTDEENYIVYTDNSTDMDGNVQLFAARYNPDVSNELIPVDDEDEEWLAIKMVLNCAMEKADEKPLKAENKIECPEGEFSPFITLCYMAESIAQDKCINDPFILAAKGEDESDSMCGVVLNGTDKDIEETFKYIVMSLAKRYKAAGVTQCGAFDNLIDILIGGVNEAYKSMLRHEVENILFGDTEEIDISDCIDEE